MNDEKTNESIEIPTPWGKPVHVTGALATFAIIAVLVAYMLYEQYKDIKSIMIANQTILLQQNKDRSDEHDRQMDWLRFVDCRTSLSIWLQAQPPGKELYFSNIPESYRHCFPQILDGKELKR